MNRVIIAGSRSCNNYKQVCDAIEQSGFVLDVVISGHAPGADQLGEYYATNNGIKLETFPADWSKHGKSAGVIRNKQMADTADCLIVIWDGTSKGSQHMINIAKQKNLNVFVYNIMEHNNE